MFIHRTQLSFLWCRREESNFQPIDYETIALPLSHVGNYIYNNSTFRIIKAGRKSPAYKKK